MQDVSIRPSTDYPSPRTFFGPNLPSVRPSTRTSFFIIYHMYPSRNEPEAREDQELLYEYTLILVIFLHFGEVNFKANSAIRMTFINDSTSPLIAGVLGGSISTMTLLPLETIKVRLGPYSSRHALDPQKRINCLPKI